MKRKNPFSNSGLEFIGRERELSLMNESIKRGQSIVLYAPRGEGKTALFDKCCSQYNYSKKFVVMRCDLLCTCNMSDFVGLLIKSMKPFTIKNNLLEFLTNIVPEISFDPIHGEYSFNIGIRPDSSKETLEKIKHYIQSSSKQYLLFIDEFQEIDNYPEKNTEALLQSFFNSLPNLVCVISGSQNRMVKRILEKMSSFYSNLSIIEISPLNCLDYAEFVVKQFKQNNVTIDEKTVEAIYNLLEGSPLYMQLFFSNLYSSVESGSNISFDAIDSEFNFILSEKEFIYNCLLTNCTSRQKEFLINLAYGNKLKGSEYYYVQSRLIEVDIVSCKDEKYYINDKFFKVWLRKKFPLLSNEKSTSDTDYLLTSQIPISKQDRDRLFFSLAYLTAKGWPYPDERAILVQLREILASNIFCPNNLRFHKIMRYLINREEASLDSNMVEEIKLYIKSINS